jgi:LysM repeat protein
MNKPNPLVPQGTLPDKGKAQIRITVFAILAIHVVMLGVLLIAGCNKKAEGDLTQNNTGLPPIPPVETNTWPTPPAVAPDTNVVPPPAGITPQAVAPLTPSPVGGPVVDQPTVAGLTEHTISKGESFYTLGKKYGVGFKAIAEANPGINPNRLKIGDKVKIPSAKTAGAASNNGVVAPTVAADGVKTYKVKSGDNLGKIGKQFGVTAKQLRAANNLKTDQIKVGQTLKIPVKEVAALPPVESIPPVPAAPPSQPPVGTPQ